MLKQVIRRFRGPILRWLSQGDLIIVGDLLANPDQNSPLVYVPSGLTAELIGNCGSHSSYPGSVVPPGWKPAYSQTVQNFPSSTLVLNHHE